MKNFLILLLTLVSVNLFSQDIHSQTNQFIDEDNEMPKIRTCVSAEHLHEMETNPLVKIQRALIEQQTQDFIANPTMNKTRAIIKIPVVVHVLYNLNSQNISNAQINSQIAILNQDFRKLNIEIPSIPGTFGPLAADCEIEFELAHTSPTGDSTTGVTRTYTTTTSFASNNNMKFTATGGKDAWNRDQYLNIWVCKLSSGLLGYAQFPGGAAATDGVVISYKAFGNTGVATAPYNKGRTTTHEIGHWLNVFHIWGDDGGSCSGSDLVNDTPNQGAENYGNPTYPKYSCANPNDGDMFMNYMDYTNDATMSMFSIGQKQRMQSLFVTGGTRAILATSTKYNYPIPASAPIACGIPTNLLISNITADQATVTWTNVVGATSYSVKYWIPQYNNFITQTTTTTSSNLTILYSQTPYKVSVQAICPSGTSAAITDTFTTLEAELVWRCANTNTEPNNFFSEAFNIVSNKELESKIQVSDDKDFYHVTTTDEQPNLLVTVKDIPMDYDVKVYNSKRELVATSQNLGNSIEEVAYNATKADDYFVEVYGYNGSFSSNACYNLITKISQSKFSTLSNNDLNNKPEIYFYPNPAVEQIAIELYADGEKEIIYNLYNALGQLVKTQNATTHAGQNKVMIDVNSLPNGIYILEYRSDIERKVQKLNIQK